MKLCVLFACLFFIKERKWHKINKLASSEPIVNEPPHNKYFWLYANIKDTVHPVHLRSLACATLPTL